MGRTTLHSDAADATGVSLPPSAVLTDGILWVPLVAVTRVVLQEQYRLPALGPASHRAAVGTSEDSVTLTALLIGDSRYIWKHTLELLADSARRGGAVGHWGFTQGWAAGLILVTAMTVRTEMQVTSLSFTHAANRRDALEVSIALRHAPRPRTPDVLIDAGAMSVMSAVEYLT